MSKAIRDRAEEHRISTIAQLLERKGLAKSTADRVGQIDAACSQLNKQGQQLTIKNVVRALGILYANSAPAESTIRNQTLAGQTYRGVIDAWRIYRSATSPGRSSAKPVDADISDGMLNEIRPESARLLVLMMRTSLRNLRRQHQILQAGFLAMPSVSDNEDDSSPERLSLTKADIANIRAFLDPKECVARGVSWNGAGQLVGDGGKALSRPGLREALEHAVHR